MFVSGLRDEPAEMAEARRSPASANDGQITPQARDTWGGRHPLLRRAACRQPPAAAPMRASLAAAIGRKWPLFSNCGGAAATAADQCFNDFRSSSSEEEREREKERGEKRKPSGQLEPPGRDSETAPRKRKRAINISKNMAAAAPPLAGRHFCPELAGFVQLDARAL